MKTKRVALPWLPSILLWFTQTESEENYQGPRACVAMYVASGKGKQPHAKDPEGVPTNQWRDMMSVQQELWARHKRLLAQTESLAAYSPSGQNQLQLGGISM